ncbi:response regulator [Alkalihalobacterium bogoriense]|uniref:response regulator n=1 Tax=Alkalihalobacterium bogoriense TaxID=246272 RepID=UPI00047D4291|nr:response regulator [Alkalihalobacterium bogoriense]
MSDNNKVNILMVDDRPENLMALEAVLVSENYHLIRAQSGEEALRFVLQYDIAVILMDVQMPGLNGFETAQIIKQRKSSRHIPILFITALSKANEHVNKGYSKGAIDYIFKPFNPNILKSKVEAFVQIYLKQKEIEIQRNLLKQQTIDLTTKSNNLEMIIHEKTKELVRSNKELQVSQERFQKVFQFSPNLMAIRSLATHHYIDVNRTWSEFTGYELDDIIHRSDNFLNIKSSDGKLDGTIPFDIQDSLFNERVSFETKSGEVREGLLSTEQAMINDEPCIISTITDITERTQMEKEISRLDRLNLVGEMAAGIAHEIRNPMTTVLGFLQLMKIQEEMRQPQEYIDLMIDELNRANGIITEFLTFAKDKAADKKIQSLNDVVMKLHPLLRAEALMGNNSIELKLEECPPLFLDEKEIRQLILNIGLNGLEAMTEGGVLTIQTYKEGQSVILAIKDQGPGIKKEDLENIGTPFFTTKEDGTGLGLAICYSIASRHSACIDIKTSSKGTAFIIRFEQKEAEVELEPSH